MTDHLVAHLRTALSGAVEGHRPFQILSDEELVAIEDPRASEFSMQPWIDSLEDDLAERTVARFGERSLLLRGLLRPKADESGATLVPSDELRLAAEARYLGVGYIMMRSTYARARSGRYVVLQPEIGGYEEDIDSDGMHVYSACTYAAATRRLAEYALPHVRHNSGGVRVRIRASHWQRWLVNELGADVRPVQVNLFLRGASVALEPDVWLVASAGDVGLLAVREQDDLLVTSMTRARLERRLAERVAHSLRIDLSTQLIEPTPL
ncbi:hypothetical protein [Solicola gregarius]|uniref:Uncharacterized protein n=1 Tax=Solicola gregarius TaxID=2908642 RepID=A0AA46YMB6_9ACTN|nr:hypothetical protein [Solicola gregarius]UYM06371.1 hypothetical protein L0C25_04650 [Solicola gregarius]